MNDIEAVIEELEPKTAPEVSMKSLAAAFSICSSRFNCSHGFRECRLI